MKTPKANIFLVEDDHNFGSVLKAYMELNDYKVSWIDDGRDALREFQSQNFDICILDVMLPNMDGFTIATSIKKLKPEIPFVFLTAKTLKEDILRGYATGADDYVTKPFDSEVLICKVEAILARRSHNKDQALPEGPVQLGKFLFDPDMRTISMDKNVKKLSPMESKLLLLLHNNRNSVLSRKLALNTIWGEESYFTTRSMDVFIAKLRKYLKADPSIQIVTVHGDGFRLMVDTPAG
jgi:DNA-binding response OmpR family regulator